MKATSSNETINVFWTGGLDSTFRICQLSRLPVTVQPWYVTEKRKSERYERRAIERITRLLASKPSTRFTLLPMCYVDESTLLPDENIATAQRRLREKYLLGTQYEYLAKLAKQQNIKVEVCVEFSPRSKMHNTLIAEGGGKRRSLPSIPA